jgi:hypothetical protein
LLAEALEHACLHYGIRPETSKWDPAYRDEPARWNRAAQILAEHSEIANDSIHAAACLRLLELELRREKR